MAQDKIQNQSASIELAGKIAGFIPNGRHYTFYQEGIRPVTVFSEGNGSKLIDIDGNEHLDLFCKFGAGILGHGHQVYKAKLKEAIDRVNAVDLSGIETELCEKIISLVPNADKVYFGLSGTEIIQNAIRISRAVTGRDKFIRFYGHFHGNADNIMGGAPRSDEDFIPIRTVDDYETEGRARDILQAQSYILPWNELDLLSTFLESKSGEIAMIIMEPVCINGGGIIAEPGYLEGVRALCDKYGIVLVFDEVITGFRMALGGISKLLKVQPDITIFGKALGGGELPVSAMVGNKEIMNPYSEQRVVYGGTFNGYPLGLAAAKATLDVLEADPGCFNRMGDFLVQIATVLSETAESIGIPILVQGIPTALVFHVTEETLLQSENYGPRVKYLDFMIKSICEGHGIRFAPRSRMYASLSLNELDVEFFKTRIGDALIDAKRQLF